MLKITQAKIIRQLQEHMVELQINNYYMTCVYREDLPKLYGSSKYLGANILINGTLTKILKTVSDQEKHQQS